ncbi:MAG: hypothetical protein WD069_11790 [Planctomycetales bacterium]
MPTIQRDWSVQRRHLIETAIFGIPFLACVLVPIFFRPDLFFTCIIIAVPIWLIGFTRQCRRFHRFECPTCGVMLSRKDGDAGEPVVFHCERCETVWDTGFTESSD